MKLLALDTSSMTATVALLDDDKLIGEYTLNHKKNHSQKLMPMIEELINSCDLTPKDIDVFAVSLGPGSFTGLRIGIATITTMAQALNKIVVGVPTLEALAFNLFNTQGLVCPIIDAQRDLVYTGLYQWIDGHMIEVIEQQVLHIDELIYRLKEEEEKIIFVGDALEKFHDILKHNLREQFNVPPRRFLIPSASSVGEAAKVKIQNGLVSDMTPIYMRKSAAEVQYEERMKGRE
ncbi:tRNA (adenosine(37)-N6)-threonylcarbamoyltransferase complex dimerization subunit type 1 TsaB [Alkaliphilus sp. MSJ-5]|uniref:tRNA (Adenosine(37)-N6)-threonylcarbamoyltransferase complex dimerization subunit type 1 TsaB n=1 Tax=Alkaliphilus flagellatus TaxID=2841507 RepID=A0ABS6G2K8_9FIRM|nr:tRNA (adenosine(37)-N6)-threonylcarbamoyltransferase complex dimerization subunit type 1 TsaB [Alkaliphilus flagellatus]MBU5676718.1 tRNA (adenosine(37)-N6)-threonylcarbamoyltransferase complex dimerization subunit type 1 TsaB [Alkaliphilus flagellatus]